MQRRPILNYHLDLSSHVSKVSAVHQVMELRSKGLPVPSDKSERQLAREQCYRAFLDDLLATNTHDDAAVAQFFSMALTGGPAAAG